MRHFIRLVHRHQAPNAILHVRTPTSKIFIQERRLSGPGFIICEACYLDRIASTCIQGHFTSTPLSSGQIQHQKSLTCMLSYFPMAIAVQEAIFSENFQLWCEAAKIFMHEELCDGTARKGKSYTLIVKDGTGD